MDKQNNRLDQLIKDYRSIHIGKKRARALKAQLVIEKNHLTDLEARVEKEYLDIKILEESSLRTLFHSILQSQDKELEIERQEYLMAVLRHKECEKVIELIEYELDILTLKSEDEKVILSALEHELAKQDEGELYDKSIYLPTIKTLNIQLKNLLEFQVEVFEALEATKFSKKLFREMLKHLMSAKENENWGVYYAEIKKAKERHKSHLDQAHGYVPAIRKSFIILNAELIDISKQKKLFARTEVIVRSFNIEYFQSLIVDWISSTDLEKTLFSIESSYGIISKLEINLRKMTKNCETEIKIQKERRAALIDKMLNS